MSRLNDRNAPHEDGFESSDETSKNEAPLHEQSMDAALDAFDKEEPETTRMSDKEFLALSRDAIDAGISFQDTKVRKTWNRAQRAYNSEHMENSKYYSWRYKTRSKLFKPKTRMAVRKNNAMAASALFSTEDVVSIRAENQQDYKSKATARFIHEALNYRLDRVNPWAGPDWFLVAVGARTDTQVHGLCISKQYWQYEEEVIEYEEEAPVTDILGQPMLDEMGEPVTEIKVAEERKTLKDRLMVELYSPENVILDPTAPWTNPVQDGGYFITKTPVRHEDLKNMISQNAKRSAMGGVQWRTDISEEEIMQGHTEDDQAKVTRQSRTWQTDRYDSEYTDRKGQIIWLYECFYRIDGVDWHWWQIGENVLLSDPVPVKEAYPEQDGLRPYVRGLGEVDSHQVYPMPPVASWQSMQQEINDILNLRLDAMKMAISPITKIKRGRQIDLKQVQNRGPDSAILVSDVDDVFMERAPTPVNTYQDMNAIVADFDELAGVFSGSSVNTNRELNETVGGMRLLSQAAGSLTEFDMRVFTETWVEPVLRQCVNLIQYYESDQRVMAIAGENAGLFPMPPENEAEPAQPLKKPEETPKFLKIGINDVIDRLSKEQVIVRVDAGLGSLNKQEKFQQLMASLKGTLELMPLLQAQGIMPDGKELLTEIWGLGGYKDGAARFFKQMDMSQKEDEPSDEEKKLMAEMKRDQMREQAETKREAMRIGQSEKDRALKAHQIDIEKMIELLKLALDQQAYEQADGPDGLDQFKNPGGGGMQQPAQQPRPQPRPQPMPQRPMPQQPMPVGGRPMPQQR